MRRTNGPAGNAPATAGEGAAMATGGTRFESRANEVEILEFLLGGRSFGVDVLRIRAVEQYEPRRVTADRRTHPAMAGRLRFREHSLPLVDLRREIAGGDAAGDGPGDAAKMVLVMEREGQLTAFLVDGVGRTRRAPKAAIHAAGGRDGAGRWCSGSLQTGGGEIPLVDLERVADEVLPRERIRRAEEPEPVAV